MTTEPTIELFISEAQPADLMWSVPPPTLSAANDMYEATRIAHPDALTPAIEELTRAYPNALYHALPLDSPSFPALAGDFKSLVKLNDAYLLAALQRARLTKTDYEITQIRKANEISSRAHEVVMRVLGSAVKGLIKRGPDAGIVRPLLPGEWTIEKEAEAEAIFVASCRREG